MLTYQQTTYDTCLACSLLLAAGKVPSRKEELRIIHYSLRFSKESFAIGHLDFFAKTYKRKIHFYVESASVARLWRKIKYNKLILMKPEKIKIKLISKLLKFGPVICYLDNFVLHRQVHYPHYIVVFRKLGNRFEISDPWDGKTKTIDKNMLSKGIRLLRNHLLFSPQIIQLLN